MRAALFPKIPGKGGFVKRVVGVNVLSSLIPRLVRAESIN